MSDLLLGARRGSRLASASRGPWFALQGRLRRSQTDAPCRRIHDGRTRLSNFWAPTGGIVEPEAGEEPTIALLRRAGFVRQSHSGIFHLLPLGLKVQEKIEHIIDHEMQSIGASKLSLSSVSSEALWEKSGRLSKNPELLRLIDRKDSKFILSPTHEEEITTLVSGIVRSYKDLPVRLYQTSRKYRDELRPRQGLLRAKEFLMKDLYTFDLSEADALQTYGDVKSAYTRIFDQLGLEYLVAEADSGNMGGNLSHEYQLVSPIGEDVLFSCGSCGYVANEEVLSISDEETNCPKCHNNSLQKRRAIEVGHTFHLGTRYSIPLAATIADRSDRQLPIQMGCHGIGISRIIAAAAALRSVGTHLRWPLSIAPFKSVIICDSTTQPAAAELYDRLENWSLAESARHETPRTWIAGDQSAIDDRNKSISWKLKDANLIGYPVVFILGSQFKSDGSVDVVRQDAPSETSLHSIKEHETISRMVEACTGDDLRSGPKLDGP